MFEVQWILVVRLLFFIAFTSQKFVYGKGLTFAGVVGENVPLTSYTRSPFFATRQASFRHVQAMELHLGSSHRQTDSNLSLEV